MCGKVCVHFSPCKAMATVSQNRGLQSHTRGQISHLVFYGIPASQAVQLKLIIASNSKLKHAGELVHWTSQAEALGICHRHTVSPSMHTPGKDEKKKTQLSLFPFEAYAQSVQMPLILLCVTLLFPLLVLGLHVLEVAHVVTVPNLLSCHVASFMKLLFWEMLDSNKIRCSIAPETCRHYLLLGESQDDSLQVVAVTRVFSAALMSS